ncbi:outer membrane homotrimeric porin [Desulfovibrio inopinatus]|uniref:outer membrane homotrimeric porin n=1 Tax=Desulfovibrio inopinatus TaxID=102109 RepID=UPI000421A38B|nr:outer membrane homotrimeric porin [Desulfovibrio inopinatus]
MQALHRGIALAILFLCVGTTALATEIRMVGDFRIAPVLWSNKNFTGWNDAGTRTYDALNIWQRSRLRMDFIANEHLKFRFGLRLPNNTDWGNGTFTADNSTTAVQVYQAYLHFTWPDTDIAFTVGMQPFSLPISSVFYQNPVINTDNQSSSIASLVVEAPIVDDLVNVRFGFGRPFDSNGMFDSTTTEVDDEFDFYFLTIPITPTGAKITPWAMAGVYGKAVAPSSQYQKGLLTAGSYLTPSGYQENQNFFFWAGAAFEISVLDPIRFYGDVMYGQGAFADAERNRRQGWFADTAVEYTGLEWVTPQLAAWWGTGEDDSITNGSERLPATSTKWGPGGTIFYDNTQPLTDNNLGSNPIGSWGLAFSFKDISFVPKLKHTLTLAMANGTNSDKGIRQAVAVSGGNGEYVALGKDLTTSEWLYGINAINTYAMNDNLTWVLELGWAKLTGAKASVWNSTRNFTGNINDPWYVGLGLIYKF